MNTFIFRRFYLFITLSFLVSFIIFNNTKNSKKTYFGSSITLNYLKNNDSTNYVFKASTNPTMYKYFKNLRQCRGRNLSGSCGYVAISMLLSYYDTFYNDDIIPEQYERQITPTSYDTLLDNSPGIKTENNVFYDNVNSYTQFYLNNASNYFVSYLICMCMNNPEINYYNQANIINNTNDVSLICSLDSGNIGNILEFYLDDIGLSSDFTVVSESIDYHNQTYPYQNANIVSFIKDNLDKGYPVLASKVRYNNPDDGHSFIIHSYINDSANLFNYDTKFFGNNGMVSNYDTDDPFFEEEIVEAYALIPNCSMEGSNNYSNFITDPNLNWTLNQYQFNHISNSKNLWYDFKISGFVDLNNQFISHNNTFHTINKITSISYYGYRPQTFYLATSESYDTTFTGQDVYDSGDYMVIYDDINGDLESDYFDLNTWARISINNNRTLAFNPTFYSNPIYKRYNFDIIDYLYAW